MWSNEKKIHKLELRDLIYTFMIIDEIIKVKKNSNNFKHYSSLKYEVDVNQYFHIKVQDLAKNSHINVNVKCDICGLEKTISYFSYQRNINASDEGMYTCIKCSKIKSKKTNLERYGAEYPIQNEDIKNKRKHNNYIKYGVDEPAKLEVCINKVKSTKKERYGVENFNNQVKSKQTKLEKYNDANYTNRVKYVQTCLERYDLENVSEMDWVKEKKKMTFLKNFGVDNYSKSEQFKNNRIEFLISKYEKLSIISVNDNILTLKCDCDQNHNFDININILRNRIVYKTVLCTVCNPVNSFNSSGNEIQLQKFIQENYDGSISYNNREVIKPYELDIYLPELNLAFEYDGLFWNSEINKENNYHINKTEKCEKLGIKLIHIYEDDWNLKQDIIKSRILNLLSKSNTIPARKCQIKEIEDNNLIRNFLKENHIQGFVGSKVKICLFYNEELISIMLFGSVRKSMGKTSKVDCYELLRFCNKLNYSVVGGASKLFKYFLKIYNPKEIISYADRSWSTGNLYHNLGFKLSHKTKPNYYYIIDGVRNYRFLFRKDILVKQGFNPLKSEHEIMLERKIYRIYDSGHLKFTY